MAAKDSPSGKGKVGKTAPARKRGKRTIDQIVTEALNDDEANKESPVSVKKIKMDDGVKDEAHEVATDAQVAEWAEDTLSSTWA